MHGALVMREVLRVGLFQQHWPRDSERWCRTAQQPLCSLLPLSLFAHLQDASNIDAIDVQCSPSSSVPPFFGTINMLPPPGRRLHLFCMHGSPLSTLARPTGSPASLTLSTLQSARLQSGTPLLLLSTTCPSLIFRCLSPPLCSPRWCFPF